jgi:hypothetical protein
MTEDIKEDFLEVDAKIPGQNYVCLSFVSPEKVLKNKETFFLTKFLEYIINDNTQNIQQLREKMLNKEIEVNHESINTLYEDWKYDKTEDLETQFFEINDYKTSIRGLKVRGVYDSQKEASIRAQVLRRKDPSFNVFVGQVGYWLPWDPECENIPDQEYQEGQLNELVKKYKENLNNRDDMYEQVKTERIKKAKEEVNARKELLKAQNEMKIPENTEVEDSQKIEELRNIVDESDKLYYDNLAKESKNQPTIDDINSFAEKSETLPSVVSTIEEDDSKPISNFKSEELESLETDDPWLKQKKSD